MATVLKVPEKTAKKLLKELNMTPGTSEKKIIKQLLEVKENLNGDSIEDMDLTSSSKSLLEEIVEAVDEEKDLKVVSVDAEEEDQEEDEMEETPKKKGRPVKTKTKAVKVKTKAVKKVEKKGLKNKKSESSGYNKEYEDARRQQGTDIHNLIEKKGPISLELIMKKLGLKEARVLSHIKNHKKDRESGKSFYKKDKQGKYSVPE